MSSSEGARSEIRLVLACARHTLGTGAAVFAPLDDGLAPEADGAEAPAAGALLAAHERGTLRAGGPVRGPSPLGERLFVPVPAQSGGTRGGLGVLYARPAAEGPRDEGALRELAGLLGHALAAQARPEQDELARFFALSYDNLCIAGFDGYFKLLNPSWSASLGYSLEELYSRPYVDFVHPEDRGRTEEEGEAIRGGEKTITFSNRYVTRSGAVCHFQWTAVPAPERQRIYAVARDVTEQRRVEEELKRSRAAAEAASQAKSSFLAMMSHELRTPLNSVIGFANLLLRNDGGRLGAEELSYASRIQRNGESLLALINSILDLSRIEAGRVEPMLADANLTALAREVVETLRPQAPSAVRLMLDIPPEPITLRTDEGRLRQILYNLVGNGLKFTARGSVTLRLARKPLRFEVEDTGPGIPAEHLGTIFEPFKQLEEGAGRLHGGTGLGLAISRSFADALGLGIEVQSEVGRGTVFRVVLEKG